MIKELGAVARLAKSVRCLISHFWEALGKPLANC